MRLKDAYILFGSGLWECPDNVHPGIEILLGSKDNRQHLLYH